MNSTNQETKLKTLPGPWSLGEMTGNWRDIDLPDHGGVMRIVWKMEDDEVRNDAVVAALNAASAPPAERRAPRCSYCDGTGDVHGIDGEWRGICTECDAGTALRQQAAPKAAPVTQQAGYAEVIECGNSYAKVKLKGEAFGSTKVGDIFYAVPQTEAARKAVIEALSGVQALSAAPGVDMAAVDERQAFEAWYKQDCVIEGAAAKLAAKAAWKARATLAASPTHPAEQQAAPKTAPGVGNSGFDHQTAADFLSGKTVSDEAVRKFVAASRWAHDERAALSATLLAMHGVLASREAEIALLKRSLLDAEADAAAPQPYHPAQAAESVPAVDEREQERIAFKDAHRHLELDEVPDAWGRPMFKHSHVEASWIGWKARASHGQAPAKTGNSVSAQADSVQEDAALWRWLAEYLVGTRTDLDDEIVASETVNDLRKLVKAAIKQGEKQ